MDDLISMHARRFQDRSSQQLELAVPEENNLQKSSQSIIPNIMDCLGLAVEELQPKIVLLSFSGSEDPSEIVHDFCSKAI